MNGHSESGPSFDIDTRLVGAGAILTASGAMIASAGMAMVAVALGAGARRWMQRHDMPSREQATATFHRATEAARAGREAWHTVPVDSSS